MPKRTLQGTVVSSTTGQNRGRARRAPLHAPGHEEDRAAARRNTTPTTRQNEFRWATLSGSKSAGRCRSSSVGTVIQGEKKNEVGAGTRREQKRGEHHDPDADQPRRGG